MIAHCHENDPDTAIFGEGNGFIIKNKKKLEEEYLKKYKVCQAKEKDGTPQFESFHRQWYVAFWIVLLLVPPLACISECISHLLQFYSDLLLFFDYSIATRIH